MNLDTTLFWIAMISCAALLLRARPSPRQPWRPAGWTVVGAAILAVGGAAKIFLPAGAGLLAGTLWAVFIALPSVLIRAILRDALGQRYARAERLARVVRWLHPADGWRDTPTLYRALSLAQAGQRERAADLFHGLINRPKIPAQIAATARVYLYRMEGRWDELLAWTEGAAAGQDAPASGGNAGPDPLIQDPSVLLMRVRALGETGRLREMLAAFQAVRARLEGVAHPTVWLNCQLYVFAFGGREAAVAHLLAGPLAGLTPEARAFWQATARMAAGQTVAARADLRALAARSDDQEFRHVVDRRLTCDLADAGATLSPAEQAALDGIEAEGSRDRPYGGQGGMVSRGAYATNALILVNIGVFVLETVRGGSENFRTLSRLGALWPPAVLEGGQWYRLVTAMFLHLGLVHLVMNLLALSVIGPWVEQTLGRVRYVAVYFLTGVGSMAVVVFLIRWGWMQEEVLVGASGAIMGLIGATGALLLAGWRRERSALAARRLRGVLLVVALQTGFDLVTPQVSFTAHAAGVVLGFLVTAVLERFSTGPGARQLPG